MSELASNVNGDPFEVLAPTRGCRVRRMKHKGASPEARVVLPIEAEVEDPQREVGATDLYRVGRSMAIARRRTRTRVRSILS